MEVQKTKECTCFYVGRSGEEGTTKAFCHGKPDDLVSILTDTMNEIGGFDVIVYRAVDTWKSANPNDWRDKIEEAFNDPEWESSPTTVTTCCTPTEEKDCICFYVVGDSNPISNIDGFFHGKPIDLANILVDAMSRKSEFAAIVYSGWFNWGWDTSKSTRERIQESTRNPELMSTFMTSPYNLTPEELKHQLMWIEKLYTDIDEFLEWVEAERAMKRKAKERYDQELAEYRKDVFLGDESRLGMKRRGKNAFLKDRVLRELRKLRPDSDDEPPDLIA
jgi:hypothetical protein